VAASIGSILLRSMSEDRGIARLHSLTRCLQLVKRARTRARSKNEKEKEMATGLRHAL